MQQIQANAIQQAVRDVHIMYVKQQIALLSALKEKFGVQVEQIAAQAVLQDYVQLYQQAAQQSGGNSIEDLIRLLWEPLRSKGYDFTVTPAAEGVQIHCTACPYARLYRNLGGSEWGFALYCAADEALAKAFNPAIGFRRTQTLMEGHPCCDHFYYYCR